jgi:hypothetical protein
MARSRRRNGKCEFSARLFVTAPLLPRRFFLDPGDKVGFINKVVEEVVPGLGCQACCCDHVCQLFDAVICEGSHAFFLPCVNADDAGVGQIVIVADDCLEEVLVFTKHFRHVAIVLTCVTVAISLLSIAWFQRAPSSKVAIRPDG